MRSPTMILLAISLGATGCWRSQEHRLTDQRSGENVAARVPGRSADMVITSVGAFGGPNVNVKLGGTLCSGRVTLAGGEATVVDSCFTGDSNIVLCTDATTPSPIKCKPEVGKLLLSGSGNDVVAYARVQ
jgi:hypothetical protein